MKSATVFGCFSAILAVVRWTPNEMTFMRRTVPGLQTIVFVTLLATFVCNTNAVSSKKLGCPDECWCHYDHPSRNWVTDCSENNLTSMPYVGLDKHVFRLDVSKNLLTNIKPFPARIELARLQMSENSLTKINKTTFAGLTYLLHVDLMANSISHVDVDAFEDSAELITLNLERNPIGDVSGPFLSSRSLMVISLVKCNISTLSRQFFSKLNNLIEIDLSENPLRTIDDGVFDSSTKSLLNLYLNNCSISHISKGAFSSLVELTILELMGNNLAHNYDWTQNLSTSGRLEHILLTDSGIYDLPRTMFSDMSSLKSLILSNNKLINLEPGLFQNLTHLETLELNYCGLSHLNQNLFNDEPIDLKKLGLAGNPLQIPNEGPVLPPQLNVVLDLDMSKCNLTYLPVDAFSSSFHIKQLILNNNNLTNTKENNTLGFVKHLIYLNHLDLSFNNIQYLDSNQFMHNHNLRSVNLTGNHDNVTATLN